MSAYVIVGGSSGIGLELVKSLSAQGHTVYVYARTSNGIEELPGVHFHVVDVVSDSPIFLNLPEKIDGLAYLPGSITLAPFGRIKLSQFSDDYRINVLGAVLVIQACINGLKASGSSGVVLFSTVAAGTGMPYHASIAAAKGAVEALTRSLAAEFAASGIRFNCIAPSLTDTPLASRLLNSDEKKDASNKRHPLGRYGAPSELAQLAAFLIQPMSSWITGQIMHADGGMSSLKLS